MDRDQHTVQDSAEAYAVYKMQLAAEEEGFASGQTSARLWDEYLDYLASCNLSVGDMTSGEHSDYTQNVDAHIPAFIQRLKAAFPSSTALFNNVEAEARNRGEKADVHIHLNTQKEPIRVSLKNYKGKAGIKKPQVMSGTFLSFAHDFLFERVGPGIYLDPRDAARATTFSASNKLVRDAAVQHLHGETSQILEHLHELDRISLEMRLNLLGEGSRYYSKIKFSDAKARAVEGALPQVKNLLDCLESQRVKDVFLQRIGMDGSEEVFFFDARRYLESVTDASFRELRNRLKATETRLSYRINKSSLEFRFVAGDQARDQDFPTVTVPFTINTNGAWHRPRVRYEGQVEVRDKGHPVLLYWGERRPYKSLELATSVNTYVDFSRSLKSL